MNTNTNPNEASTLTFETLKNAVSGSAAAFRCRAKLQPAGGEGDKVFPPTYAGAIYAKEERRVLRGDGTFDTIPCVLLDSVQSQANRLEEALQRALDTNRISEAGCTLPVIEVDFSGEALLDQVGRISSLEAPHRAADAILRDSIIDEEGEEKGKAFRKSRLGEKLDHASLSNATPLYEICPTALVFGIWDSTGPKGGLGAKFQRAVVSEIVGINAAIGDLSRGVRKDPLGIRSAAKVVKNKGDKSWALVAENNAKNSVSPSEINHSSVPFPKERNQKTEKNYYSGVTIDYAELTTVISLPALRRLRFPLDNKPSEQAVNVAGQTVLSSLSLLACSLAAESGYDLRSRCLLWPNEPLVWELLDVPGEPPKSFKITSATALSLLKSALGEAEALGLTWRTEPLKLKPSAQLVALLKKSQEIAATGDDTEE